MLVFFDIDDTLIDHTAAFRAASIALHRHIDSPAPVDDFTTRWSAVHQAYFARYLTGELTYEQQARARIRAVVDATLADDEADRHFAHYLATYEAAWALFPDVESCLDDLARHHLGIISNGQRHQQVKKLERTGILDRFDCVVISEECGHAKPKREIFQSACSRAGQAMNRAMYVGDRYDVDAMGARQAGLIGVWLDRAGAASDGHVPPVVSSLSELRDVVDAIDARHPAR